MKRLAILLTALAIMAGLSMPAFAQGKQQLCFPTSGTATNCVPVTPQNPYPVTATISPSGDLPITGTITATQGTTPWTISPSLTTPGTSNLVSAGFSQQIASNPTVTALAYTAGQCFGGFNAVSVAVNNGQSGLLTTFNIFSISGATPTFTVYLFDSQPTTSTCTNRGIFTLSAADIDRMIGPPTAVTLVAPTSSTTPSSGNITFSPPLSFVAGGATSSGLKTIYYGIVTGATTPSTSTDFHTRTGVVLD